MSKSAATLAVSLTAVPTIWFGGCLANYARDDAGELQGPAAIIEQSGHVAEHVAPVAENVAATLGTIPGAGEAANVANIAAIFADTFGKQIDSRLSEIEARNAAASKRTRQGEYVGAAIGSTLSAGAAALSAFMVGQRRRKATTDEATP